MTNIRNKKTNRVIALAVLVCLVVFSVCTVVFVAEHTRHNCTGAHCETCVQLHQAAAGLKLLAGPAAAGVAGAAIASAVLFVLLTSQVLFASTPVSRKVQLNN